MFDKFGELDSVEELNRAAAAQASERDEEALVLLAEENGIDSEDVEDYLAGCTEELATPLMAAVGKLNVEKEESFGVIPLSKARGRWEVFLIQHSRGRYWGFPKGHGEANETPEEAAFRELKEETNLDLVRYLQKEPLTEQYQFMKEGRRVFKKVTYFIAEVGGEVRLQQEEIQNGIWVPFPEALDKVTHSEGKSILAQVEKILPKI